MSHFSPEPLASDTLQTWETASRREWLATNGIGGYASASVAGANTRRYHGLLVPAFAPPVGRAVVLSKLEEEVRVEDALYLLSANKYPSVVQPQGFRHLAAYESRPVPTFTYNFHEGTVTLEKRIWMAHGRNTVYVQYTLVKAPEPIKFGLVPLMAYKDYHTEQHRWDGFHGTITSDSPGKLKFVAYDTAEPLYFTLPATWRWSGNSGWFLNFEHTREQERGLDCTEDLYCPGRWDSTLAPGQSVTLIATVETDTPDTPELSYEAEYERQLSLLTQAKLTKDSDPFLQILTLAADQFLIEHTDKVARATIMAGYPWFTDWGRDTMISLPGLCLSTGRVELAKQILTSYSGATQNGLLPNRFTDSGGGAEYNTVDASLWFFHAVHQYAEVSGDWAFATDTMLPVLEDILTHHINGTDYHIGVDPQDGLLHAGQPGVQLTWMDAKVGDWVVTPRIGKPVEINALWHNALKVAALLARRAGKADTADTYEARAGQAKASFAQTFWNPDTQCLYDVIGDDNANPDSSIRPNQIFAVSLPFPLLSDEQARAVVGKVGELLLTPYGLRTLAPGSPDYQGHYGPGDQRSRDGAYHQGTVWPWLLGAFIDAHLFVHADKDAARDLLLPAMSAALSDYGMDTLCEIRDGDAPHAPNGCIAQAWSVGELLRALRKLA